MAMKRPAPYTPPSPYEGAYHRLDWNLEIALNWLEQLCPAETEVGRLVRSMQATREREAARLDGRGGEKLIGHK